MLNPASKTLAFEFVDSVLSAKLYLSCASLASPFPYVFSAEGAISTSAWGVAPRLAMRRAVGAKHLPNTDGPAFGVEHALRDFKLA